jgi:hypothetical protein
VRDVTEPGERDLAALAAQVERYELTSALSPQEFRDYFDDEVALEQQLLDAAVRFGQIFDFGSSRDALEQVIALNLKLRSIADRELARTDIDDEFRRRLSSARDEASGLILVVQGQIFQSHADEAILASNMRDTLRYLEQSRQCFQELADLGLPQADFGGLAADLALTKYEFFEASTALQRGRYERAKEGFHHAFAKYSVLLEDVTDAGGPDERISAMIAEFQREFTDQKSYTQVMLRYADFFCQVQSNNCSLAVQYARDAVDLYETWLQSAISNEQPRQIRNYRKMELAYVRGWLAWSEAELALEQHQWDACAAHIEEARRSWFSSTDMALRHELRGVMAPQYENSNTEMLLQSTQRRCWSEKRLFEEIEKQREEMRHLRRVSVHAQGGHVMNESSSFEFNGPVNAAAVGPNAKARVDRVGGDQIMASTTDLRELAAQLAELREALAAGARTDEEKAAVGEVERAEAQARQSDERGARRHLAAAGRWALTVAEKLALPVAEAAIKASIGG